MKQYSTFVGMDVHKNSIEIAIAQRGRNGEVRSYGKIDGTLEALDKVVRKLVSKGGHLHFVYEAGPCGYEIYRHLTAKGYDCAVVAPSRIPKKSGDRIKNDRRDACMLARLDRAGELTPVYVPFAEDEAIRDLTRAREDAKIDEKRSKQRLKSFLLRHRIALYGQSDLEQSPHALAVGYQNAPSKSANCAAGIYRYHHRMQPACTTVDRSDPAAVASMAHVSGRSSTSSPARCFVDRGGHNRCRNRRPETF